MMDYTIELLPAHQSVEEQQRSERKRRWFMRRRAIKRWLLRTFRLYRYESR